jgi:uncharacterized membrane protein YtjA (UPF0391 family)
MDVRCIPLARSLFLGKQRGGEMITWALTFLILAIIAGVLGFSGIAGTAAGIAKILFLVFLVLLVASVLFGGVRSRPTI